MGKVEWQVIDQESGVYKCRYWLGPAEANMVLVRLSEGKLLAVSPAANMQEEDWKEIEALGEVVALLAPNGFHHSGIGPWSRRWPGARCFAHQKVHKRLNKQCGLVEPFLPLEALEPMLPEHVRLFSLPHVKNGEVLLEIEGASGRVWVITDLLLHLSELPRHWFLKMLFFLARSAPGLRINGFFSMGMVQDRRKLKEWLHQQLDQRPPDTVLFGHGEPLAGPALPETLRLLLKSW